MKTRLLILAIIGIFSVQAQTTHNLNWEINITGTGNADLTIDVGDTIIWTWLDENHTVENDPANSVETFDSGFLGPTGSTFSHTFMVVGVNDYLCGVHGAPSMSGTITVQDVLGIDDETIKTFQLTENPVDANLNINLAQTISEGNITVYNLLGKQIITKTVNNAASVSLDVSGLNKGLYLVSINSENGKDTKRFVKN